MKRTSISCVCVVAFVACLWAVATLSYSPGSSPQYFVGSGSNIKIKIDDVVVGSTTLINPTSCWFIIRGDEVVSDIDSRNPAFYWSD